MIYLKNICKTFIDDNKKEVHAVNDVSLTINDGDIFGIIGFSGAGKSTLVRCINLLERPTSGTVEVDGKDLTKLSEKELRESRKKIGMIFQHFNLFLISYYVMRLQVLLTLRQQRLSLIFLRILIRSLELLLLLSLMRWPLLRKSVTR